MKGQVRSGKPVGAELPPAWLVPGGVGHPEGSWQSSGYRPARTRARWAQGFFVAVGLELVWEFVLTAQAAQFVDQLTQGSYISQSAVAEWVDATQSAANLFVAIAIGLAIAFIAWLSRTVDNVPSLVGGTPHESPRWAVVWWFVPIAFLWKPYTVVRESWDRLATPFHNGRNNRVLGWWLCWIGGIVITRAANVWASDPNASLAALKTAYADEMLGLALLLAAAVLGFLVIREMEARAGDRAVALGLEVSRGTPAEAAPAMYASGPEARRYCVRCGGPRQEGDAFCGSCGGPFQVEPSVRPATTKSLYGPNSEEVADALAALGRIDSDLAQRIADARQAVPDAAWQDAQAAVQQLRRDRKVGSHLRAAEDRVADWLASRQFSDSDEVDVFADAADAAQDAVAALILQVERDATDFAALYGPWSKTMSDEDGDEAEKGASAEPE
jgi:hypothetical protein